ncbi:ATP-binding protein [Streptomyces sp. XD-27]|uniref:ATP-binding protein n=1 Tax=Streptomyces sp. XD-27 TaxID=3062779 RepID=UPI0026F47E4B|nr:ATP-binding protein [Streptomyces sp. XD-27]WKX72421.1 ATP-binding protein [Streptomyces sp. XD-27]
MSLPLTRRLARAALLVAAGAAPMVAAGAANATPVTPQAPAPAGMSAVDTSNVGVAAENTTNKVTYAASEVGRRTFGNGVPAAGKATGKAAKHISKKAAKTVGKKKLSTGHAAEGLLPVKVPVRVPTISG